MYSNLPRDRTRFHQLGACERECFCLAGILIAEGDSRQELLEILAAGKYPIFFRLNEIAFQAPVVQAPAFNTKYSEQTGGITWLCNSQISNVNKRPVCGFPM